MESIAALMDRAGTDDEPAPSVARIRAATSDRERVLARKALGDANEARLLRVLADGPLPRWILGVRKATRDEDRRGVDLVATILGGRELGIQVKSSGLRALEFIERYRLETGSKRPAIALVVVHEWLTDEELLRRAIERISMIGW